VTVAEVVERDLRDGKLGDVKAERRRDRIRLPRIAVRPGEEVSGVPVARPTRSFSSR
jgi:hypothetical protein